MPQDVDLDVNVRWPILIAVEVAARHDALECVASGGIGLQPGAHLEASMIIVASFIGLPKLKHGPCNGLALRIKHLATQVQNFLGRGSLGNDAPSEGGGVSKERPLDVLGGSTAHGLELWLGGRR